MLNKKELRRKRKKRAKEKKRIYIDSNAEGFTCHVCQENRECAQD